MAAKTKEIPNQISERLQAALKTIIDEFENDELSVRERQIRLWKRLEYMWAGFSKVWWSEVAHDWRIYDAYESNQDGQGGYYDKEINVFRAYLETVIAALSATVPAIKCFPDDGDNPLDVLTARGGTKIASLVYTHIDAPLKWIKALFIYCTQGMIAAHNYTVEDKKYGEVSVGQYEDKEEEVEQKFCPTCGTMLSPEDFQMGEDIKTQEMDEFDPGADDVDIMDIINKELNVCPQCLISVDPELKKNKITVTRFTGTINKPKARQHVDVYGGLFVKVPNYARKQEDIPYLSLCYETHYTLIYEKYPHLRSQMKADGTKITSSSGSEAYERWGRLSPQYYGEYPQNTPTVRNWWLRKLAFNILDDDLREELEELFPDGVRCVWINDTFAEAVNECLDDHWTLTHNPLSEYIHFDPLGLLLTSIQEITNDLVSLTLQTIEHGIPQTFADPKVLNFNAYGQMETKPGMVYKAKAPSGKGLSDGFFTISTSSLSSEVEPFGNKIQEMGQFVSGALPSLFGGAQPGSSRTAAQYSMSKNQAMQRLQTPWKMINFWWKNIFAKVIPAYINCMLDDERVVKEVHGTFVNDVVKKAQLDGKLGQISIESSDDLPQSMGQIKDTIMELIKTNNPQILEAIGAPNNLNILSDVIGVQGFNVPGEDDRIKQYEEITLLLQSEAIVGPPNPMTGQPQEMPSIMPEFEVDNHKVQADICRDYLVSEAGRQCKDENPGGYKNILLHLKMHTEMLQQISGGGMAAPPQGNPQEKLQPIG